MKKFLTMCVGILLLGLYAPSLVSAQTAGYEVKGVVADKAGNPIFGASVLEQGTTNGVSTGLDGSYMLRVASPNSIIVVSYLGFKSVSLAANSTLLQKLTLEEDTMGLGEVVVIGYGTVRRNDLTGSVVAVRADQLQRGAMVSPQEMLRGKVPGVFVLPGDGGPNSGSTIRVRGAASLNASNDPLIVIDGLPIANDGGAGMANPLSSVNPNDIESFTVLKDASAAAIYGSRASNGVILITTKKGRMSANQVGGRNIPQVSYNGSVSVQTNSAKMPVMSPVEFRDMINQVYPASTATGEKIQAMVGDYNTDWQDLIFRTALSHDHNFSLYGSAGERMPYRVSFGYTNQQGTLKTSDYDRGTLDISIAPTFFKDHLTVNINAKGVLSKQIYASSSAVGSAAFFNPTIDPYWRNEDGSIDYTTTNGFWNYGTGRGTDFMPNTLLGAGPLSVLYDRDNSVFSRRFIGNAQLDYKVHGFEALRFNLNLGLDISRSRQQNGVNPGSFQAYADTEARGWGQYSIDRPFRRNQLLEVYANYNQEWGIHRLDAMAGYSWQHFFSSDRSVSFFNETQLQKGEDSRYPFNRREYFLLSFYGRVNYSIASKYLFTATVRNDGSSRFAPGNKWGLFPSGAFAWNIGEEKFLKDSRTVSALKLRLGAGQTGQQDIGDDLYSYLARYSMSSNVYRQYYMGDAGYSFYLTPQAYDPTIKWETTTTYNLGVDFGFLDGRISGSVDVYRRITDDLLNRVMTPMGSNFSNSVMTNIGSMRNQGVEFSLNVIPVQTKDWNLSLGFNGTFQNVKITKLNNTDDPNYFVETSNYSAGTGGFIARHMVGYAPRTFFCFQQIYDHNGMPIQNAFADRDGDGRITMDDLYMTGKSPSPDFFYGLNLRLGYRNWDFGFNGHGSVGNWAFNDFASNNSTTHIDINAGNLPNFANTVKRTGFTGTNSAQQARSDMFLENASFFRMDDINLGYTFQKMRNWKGSVRLAFGVQNVFVITNYSGVDPEVSGESGVDGTIWPRPRLYSLRLNINF